MIIRELPLTPRAQRRQRNRRRSLLAAAIVAALVWLWLNPLPAGAASYKQTLVNGTIEATIPFQSFGNLNGIGDCGYETAANLVLLHWPKAKITTGEVVNAYETYGSNADPNYAINGLWEEQDYLMSQGFGGHKATSITEIPQSQVVSAANHGGVMVSNIGPVRMHFFAIISANPKQLITVDDGFVDRYNWAEFVSDFTQQGETLQFYAVRF